MLSASGSAAPRTGQTIAFCVDKQHARDLAAEFCAANVRAEVVLDDTPDEDRREIFQAFEDRGVRVLCSVGVLGIGFDMPIASCAILARPTLSYSLFIQQGGRVLRPYPGKTDALILDHAGNTRRFGLLEDFSPPPHLSTIDKDADRRARDGKSGVWECHNCNALNSPLHNLCEECGAPHRRLSTVLVLNGELHRVEHADGEELPGPTPEEIQQGYLMLRWYGEAKGMSSPSAWAWYACQRRYRIPADRAKQLIPWRWRELPTIPPDEATSRWLTADWQRNRIVARYRSQAEDARA